MSGLIFIFLSIFHSAVLSEKVLYNSYLGREINQIEKWNYGFYNLTFWCATEIELPCNPSDYRRVDGTCNNLKNPIKGAGKNPLLKFLPPVYSGLNYQLRKSKTGENLPIPRRLRTQFLSDGSTPDVTFSNMLAHFYLFVSGDVGDVHDTIQNTVWSPNCCSPKGSSQPMCATNDVPADDPYLRYSGDTCMNQTRPITFQTQQCAGNHTVPARENLLSEPRAKPDYDKVNPVEYENIATSTALLDLSNVYGNTEEELNTKGRLYKNGLLKYETDDKGRVWPKSMVNETFCFLNRGNETRCYDAPNAAMNSLIGANLGRLWFYRQHNFFAEKLTELHPDWDDNKLFYEAREINIAVCLQLFYYEALPALFGYENVLASGLISASPGFRDLYNNDVEPGLLEEFRSVLRWLHTIQEGTLYMYDSQGRPYDKVQAVDLTLRTGYLDDHIEGLTQGAFRQAGGKVDYQIDPDLGGRVMGPFHKVMDVATLDLSKGRLNGQQPYVKFLEKCRSKVYASFDDLLEVIDPERVELLKRNYNNVEDIDLMAGIWLEKHMKGGFAPPTVYCVVEDQLIRNIVSDRFWYERQNRPHAFTAAQLAEIRKASVARLICDNGDGVTEIQPHALFTISEKNKITSCRDIPSINLSAWK